jgi:hypothetical protein
MANYYMLGGDGKEYGPVSAEQLRQWATEGRANAQTQVRATDGVGYVSFGTVPDLVSKPTAAPAPHPISAPEQRIIAQMLRPDDTDASVQTKRLAAILAAGNVWIKLVAVTMFVLAALLGITLVGLVIAWLPLWQGINLWGAANRAKEAVFTGSEADLMQALNKIRRSFTIGFFLIFSLALFGLAYMAIAMMMSSMGALQGLGSGSL